MKLLNALIVACVTCGLSVPLFADEDSDSDNNGGGFKVVAHLSGAQEVTDPPGGVDTDTSGRLMMRFERDLSAAKFRMFVRDGWGITQAHLHCGPAGTNGTVVAFIFRFADSPAGPGGVHLDGLASRGVITNAEIFPKTAEQCGVDINNVASLFAAIRDDLIYVNVHSEDNPAGEIRGQLFQ